jgi:hypothetical protein
VFYGKQDEMARLDFPFGADPSGCPEKPLSRFPAFRFIAHCFFGGVAPVAEP